MKENYKLHKEVTGAGDRCRWGKERTVLRIYNKLSIVNETSTHGLLRDLNYIQKTKGSYGLHQGSFKLQTITAFNQKFLRGGPGGAVFSKSAPPGRRRQKEREWVF
jgi:hypothetical protein